MAAFAFCLWQFGVSDKKNTICFAFLSIFTTFAPNVNEIIQDEKDNCILFDRLMLMPR